VRTPRLLGNAAFRLTLGAAAIMAAAMIVQSAIVYVDSSALEISRSNRILRTEASMLSRLDTATLERRIGTRGSDNLRLLINVAALFDQAHRRVAGDLAVWPAGVVADGQIRPVTIHPPEDAPYVLRTLAQPLRDGRILLIGRGQRTLEGLHTIIWRALLASAAPGVLVAVLGGIWLSHRALARVRPMHQAIARIMDGNLQERLPVGRGSDDLQQLADAVNRLLDRLKALMVELRGIGDNIAHDLRTPLSRIRTRLGRSLGQDAPDALHAAINASIADLDQAFALVSALLRLSELEDDRRRRAFKPLRLAALVAEVKDLYEPVAEEAGIALSVSADDTARDPEPAEVLGDRELLAEALANLLDNAIKFTGRDGHVVLSVGSSSGMPVLRVSDDGPGIAEFERAAVLQRFFRSDRSRHLPGSGLGLSLVAAIARLHQATLEVGAAFPGAHRPGALFELRFPRPHPGGPARPDLDALPSATETRVRQA
jgi:signal transduction histidine kinase